MSTTPGDSTWADAGLVPPDSSVPQDPSRTTVPVEAADQPRAPKPDLRDEGRAGARRDGPSGDGGAERPEDAPEADVWEQAQDGGGDEDADELTAVGDREGSEADVLEQALSVPEDDTDAYRS